MPSSNVFQVIMYFNACQSVPGHARDHKACQHIVGECYAILGFANMHLGFLVMEICSRYKVVPRHARCQGVMQLAHKIEEEIDQLIQN